MFLEVIMKRREINLLIVEDNTMLLEAYEQCIRSIESERLELKINLFTATSCNSAIYCLDHRQPIGGWNLAFLDLRIPPSRDGEVLSGEDIALYIRKNYPQSKIMFATSGARIERLHSIFRKINPEGFLFKSDIDPRSFTTAIQDVINDEFYYSPGILEIMRKEVSRDFFVDEVDRKLLYELSMGTKTAHLPEILLLSLSTIARRKRRLKDFFGVEGEEDRQLLDSAREAGII